MREVTRVVLYCDYCGRHRLSRPAMVKHEAGCTMNPARICRWRIDGHSDGTKQMDIAPLAADLTVRAGADGLLEKADIDWLRDEVDGCPPCMLAALRQAELRDIHWDAHSRTIFDYTTEVERLRAEERASDQAGDW